MNDSYENFLQAAKETFDALAHKGYEFTQIDVQQVFDTEFYIYKIYYTLNINNFININYTFEVINSFTKDEYKEMLKVAIEGNNNVMAHRLKKLGVC